MQSNSLNTRLGDLFCNTSRRMAQLDSDMRRQQSFQGAVTARVRFYEEAVRAKVMHRLNFLGELAPRSQLSERSLDVVFEAGNISDAVVIEIVAKADADADFEALVIDQDGAGSLRYWREFVAAQPKQGVLL